MAAGENFAHYVRILRTLIPSARRFDLYGRDGGFVTSSTGAELTGLRPAVDSLLTQLTLQDDSAAGSRLWAGRAPVYLLPVRDEQRIVLGVVSIICKPPRFAAAPTALEDMLHRAAPVLALLASDLSQQATIGVGQLHAAETVELRRLLDITHVQSGGTAGRDAIEAVLEAIVEHLDCDIALLHVPARGIERFRGRLPVPPPEATQLRELTQQYLFRLGEQRNETLIVNRLRETAGSPLVPFRILCVPLWHRKLIAGLVVAFGRRSRRPFDAKDAHLLEQLCPRLNELVANTYDEHTGLLTRQAFEEQALDQMTRMGDRPRCVIYGNLDQLHAINNLFGFARGDEVLRHVARLWQVSPPADGSLLCRLSGDRFVALLQGTTLNRARAWAEGLREMIAALVVPADCAGLKVTSSFGVAPLLAGQTLTHALAAAESACKAAKDRGRDRVEVFADADASLMRRHDDLRIFRELVGALDAGRFRLYAQPIVPLTDPRLPRQYEILVRFLDEHDEIILPGEFLSAATRYQLLTRLDQCVIKATVESLAVHSLDLDASHATFWINVSGQSLGDDGFADFARTLIKRHHLPRGRVGFEITENAAIGNLVLAKRYIERLRELGCEFSLDDFGTGLSSLAYLKDLQVSKLKIAGSFIRDLRSDPRSDSLVRTVLLLAKGLELETVAECVEAQETADYLASLGVTYGQGYAFGAPEPLDSVLASIKSAARASPGTPSRDSGDYSPAVVNSG